MIKSIWQQLLGTAPATAVLSEAASSADSGNAELHHRQSMERLQHMLQDSPDFAALMAALMPAMRSMFKADRVCLFTDYLPDQGYCVLEQLACSDVYANIRLGEVVVDDALALLFESATKGGVNTSAALPQAFVQAYAVQSQMLVGLSSPLAKPYFLAVQQCTHGVVWDAHACALLQAISERLADKLAVWQLHDTLNRRADQYLKLVENMPDGIIILAEQRIVFTNEVMCHMLGEEHGDDCLGKSLDDYIHPDFKALCQQHYALALKGKRKPIHELKLIDASNHLMDVVSSSMAVEYNGQAAVQIIMRDVTRRNQMNQVLEESLQRNKQLARQLIHVQEEERKKMAQNLHDDSGQLLTAMSINLQSLKQHAKGKKAVVLLADMENIVAQLFTSVRASLAALNPTHIDVLGLSDAIRSEMEAWSQRFAIPVALQIPQDVHFPCPETATAIFRVIQEALTNIAKHAGASQVWIELHVVSDGARYLTLKIRDNGCGFAVQQAQGQSQGFGLLGMRSRVELVSGMFTLESKQDVGTTIIVDFPVPLVGQD